MREELLKLLAHTDTPTICNAIELAQGRRGFNQFTRGRYVVMHETPQVAMGFARTARIAAENPPERGDEENKAIRMEYYRYMSRSKLPAMCVIEDTDPEPVGAYWGEVNTTIHRGFGLSGTLTNGVIRDFGACPENYQVIASGVSPSHRFVHVVDFAKPVTVFGLQVNEGDFVHADRNGGCIIPSEILPVIDRWVLKMQELEKIVIEPARCEGFDFDSFEKAWSELESKRV